MVYLPGGPVLPGLQELQPATNAATAVTATRRRKRCILFFITCTLVPEYPALVQHPIKAGTRIQHQIRHIQGLILSRIACKAMARK